MNIKLGNKYKDTLHGIEGIAVSMTRYLTGCDQVCLEAYKNGNIESYWFDITRIKDITVPEKDKKPGGPQKHAPVRIRA